jgi:hypothetical protein
VRERILAEARGNPLALLELSTASKVADLAGGFGFPTVMPPSNRIEQSEILEAGGHPPIAHLTPHMLRRTVASILGVCRVDTRRAVALFGHTDARMTIGVYAQLLKLGDGNVALLEQLMGCPRDEARAIFESEPVLRVVPNERRKRLPHPAAAR